MAGTMKAVMVRRPMEFGVEEIPRPATPRDGLLLQVEACGLCGSDLRTLRSGHRKVNLPWVIGHEICGSVVDCGPDSGSQWKKDDRLAVGPLAYCGVCDFCRAGRFELCENQKEIGQAWPGGFAEYVAVPGECVRLGNIQAVPKEMPSEHAAIAEPVSSCINAQEKAEVGLGDTVVIIGTGPIGCIHAALARARGAFRVIMVDISSDRLNAAKPFEPDVLVNADQKNPVEVVFETTDGKGAEIVIVATPAPVATVQAVEMARKGGRVVQFGGMPRDDSTPGVDMNLVHYRGLHIIGTTTFSPKHNLIAMKLLQSGMVPADKLISHVFSLDEFEKGAHMALEGKVLKGVFVP